MTKKKQTIDLMPTKPKTLLSKISKEHKIRFGNNHNQVMLIIQKSVLLITDLGAASWFGIYYHCTVCNPQLFITSNK